MDRGDMPMAGGRTTVVATGPMLISISPAPGASGVPAETTIRVEFSRAMPPGMEQWIDLHEGDIAGPVVPWSCAWLAGGTLVECRPDAPLKASTAYMVHLGGAMHGPDGALVDLGWGPMHGGVWLYPSMGRQHGGQPWGMMGPWRGANGAYGMVFTFTTD